MNGFLFQKLYQHRFLFLIVPLSTSGMLLVTTLFTLFSDETMFPAIMKLFFLLAGLFISSAVMSSVFSDDETKKWAYFVGGVPDGIRQHIYYSYIVTFMLTGTCMISCFVADLINCAVISEPEPIIGILPLIFYIQLFLRAVEIPFFIRFTVQKGSSLKGLVFAVLSFIFFVCLLFIPLPDNTDDFVNKFFDIVMQISEGRTPGGVTLVISLIPYISIGAYCLSYHISKKLYLKGVETYEK